ncbi:hypothetical protein ABIE09_003653 [Lysobacter enzymogenes]|jgi:hypothetical protein|uniref:hypothetical protein n=1 Tax=Lysobacter enzymogenes TaxID=69 RepID=UPI0008990175|nr:hypothetical protein [Lysobacter enzymogenes]SDX69447.1 hypothetical protein SAMN05421681_10727 [Lysobacter enzymogenes]
MKTLMILFAALCLSACDPAFDQPPLLKADTAAAKAAATGVVPRLSSPAPRIGG